jgi:hypothetical protein
MKQYGFLVVDSFFLPSFVVGIEESSFLTVLLPRKPMIVQISTEIFKNPSQGNRVSISFL